MSFHHDSEKELFEEETEVVDEEITSPRLKPFRLSTSSSGSAEENTKTKKQGRKRSSLSRFPINMSGSGSSKAGNGGGTGTLIGIPGLKRKEGAAALVHMRMNSEGKAVEVDLWNTAMDNLTAENLSKILEIAKVDSSYNMDAFIRAIEYQGFDRNFYITHALSKMSISVFCRFAVIGAIRGSNFTRIVETCEDMPQDLIGNYNSLSFVKTPKKRTDLTILRNTASIPHWCAYYMLKANISKKIQDDDCPAYLQFPGAASIPMSSELRRSHINFCIRFSALLPGGKFNNNIYLTAYQNQIPFKEIPNELSSLLGVANNADARSLTNDQVAEIVSKALIVRKG